LLSNFSLEHTFKSVQVNQGGLKLNGAYQLLVYAEDAKVLRGRVHTATNNVETLLVESKENGLEVNVDKLSTWS
jgi:hypothetical protein